MSAIAFSSQAMSPVDAALRVAAEAIRALPDRELVALALSAGEGRAVALAPAIAVTSEPYERPTAALRAAVAPPSARPDKGVAKCASRPSVGPPGKGRTGARFVEAERRRAEILKLIAKGPVPQAEIGDRLSLPGPTVTRLLAGLEAEKKIARDELEGGRKMVRLR